MEEECNGKVMYLAYYNNNVFAIV